MPRRSGPTVVKLGGSHAFSGDLAAWLATLVAAAGRVVVVPGGGPFADAVRAAQPRIGFGDRAAHRMALAAMEQFCCALVDLAAEPGADPDGDVVPAGSVAAIRGALAARRVPVWVPTRMATAADDVPWSWDVTSDSLAAWLAGRLGAPRVVLVKQVFLQEGDDDARELARRGVVDPLFPRFLAMSRAAGFVAGPRDRAGAAEALRQGRGFGLRLSGEAPAQREPGGRPWSR